MSKNARWEYRSVINADIQELNRLGNEGWQLCAIRTADGRFYLRRRREKEKVAEPQPALAQ